MQLYGNLISKNTVTKNKKKIIQKTPEVSSVKKNYSDVSKHTVTPTN